MQLLQQEGDDGDGDSGSQPEHPVARIFRSVYIRSYATALMMQFKGS